MINAQVLGSFQVALDGRSVVPRANKPRQVLALLTLNAPRVVSVEVLMDELWGGFPPRSAMTTLQTYIMQIRRNIDGVCAENGSPPAAKDVLLTSYAGYRLAVDAQHVDINTFRATVAAGLTALDGGRAEDACELLGEALARWHGSALDGVEHGRRLSVERTRIDDDALTALLARIDAQLILHRHHLVVGELAVLADKHPLDERIHGLYMTACYRSGQPHRAMEAFGALRRTLVDELGLEPSHQIRMLHQQMLSSDPWLDEGRPSQALAVATAGGRR